MNKHADDIMAIQETLGNDKNHQRSLLLVDDEVEITSSLERIFKRRHYRVIKANSGQEALAILKREEVGVVITDQRMPGMTGVELLSQVHKLYPDMIRIVLTGQADMAAVMDAVNKGSVYRFLTKPWDSNELAYSVDEAFQHHELIVERQQLMRDIENANIELQKINTLLNERIEDKAAELVHITQYDALTKLPNRLLFLDRLQQAILNARKNNKHVAVIILGLDRFNLVNNSHGHKTGDSILILVAERIADIMTENNTVARLTGDEFAIVLTELNSAQDAADLIDGVSNVLSKPFMINGNEFYTQASIGVSVFPDDNDSAEVILQNAHTAMNKAKEKGGALYQFYTSNMHIGISERLEIENDLRRAIEKEEFVIRYQPQINILSSSLVGMEALIRWQHPKKGFISPAVFIPVLEKIGLISNVGEWVIKTVCNQHRAWREAGQTVPRVSVNLSVRQFDDPNLLQNIERIFFETEFDPQKYELEFEVTESLVIDDVENIIDILTKFNDRNIRVAIDDFGTGYASLSYLTQFPIQSLKIDLSFISRINQGKSDRSIIIAIIALAHSIGLSVIAEGVEDKEQLVFLLENKCDEVQGYYFSKPISSVDMLHYMKNAPYKSLIKSMSA